MDPDLLSKATRASHAWVQYDLGTRYDNGNGIPKDHTEAVRWYRPAADQAYISAQYILGVFRLLAHVSGAR